MFPSPLTAKNTILQFATVAQEYDVHWQSLSNPILKLRKGERETKRVHEERVEIARKMKIEREEKESEEEMGKKEEGDRERESGGGGGNWEREPGQDRFPTLT